MELHQMRALRERHDLRVAYNKLAVFLRSQAADKLPRAELAALYAQETGMGVYLAALNDRIELWLSCGTVTEDDIKHIEIMCDKIDAIRDQVDGIAPTITMPIPQPVVSPAPPAPARRTEDRVTRRVVCAALRASDGELLLGLRHYSGDMRVQISQRKDGDKFRGLHGTNQGFVDQHGVYMDREEAYKVADAAGQLLRPGACFTGRHGPALCSEALY